MAAASREKIQLKHSKCLGNIVVLNLKEFECIVFVLNGIKITSVIKAIGTLKESDLGIIQSMVVGNFHVIKKNLCWNKSAVSICSRIRASYV